MRGTLGQIFSDGLLVLKRFEQDLMKVVNVLQPGPLGILEHKFTDDSISRARDDVEKAIQRWKHNNNYR